MSDDIYRINENVYEVTPEIHKALSSPGYTSRASNKESDFLILNKHANDSSYTDVGDKKSERKKTSNRFT